MFFLPLRWTERIGSCRANAMVVPTRWFQFSRYSNYELIVLNFFLVDSITMKG
ncbi:MAG: hypothetical protein NTW61_07175 [Candidatus Melainabacteria bacterium]|nr:hypothetical protein [Candidatus Melainabacteria bacterium]